MTASASHQLRETITPSEQHRHLDQLLDELRAQTLIDDPRSLCAFWRRFESELLAHLAAEEEVMLPAFALTHPEEANMLIDEHQLIRQLVDELGIRVDLHTLRASVADELVALLHDHGRREDRYLHSWFTTHAPGKVSM